MYAEVGTSETERGGGQGYAMQLHNNSRYTAKRKKKSKESIADAGQRIGVHAARRNDVELRKCQAVSPTA